MITRDEYLKALETVKKYREQIKAEKKEAAEIANSKFLSEFDIPLKFQKLFGEYFIYTEKVRDYPGLKWDACFELLTVADLKREPYRIDDLSKFRNIRKKEIDELKLLYKELGFI